MIGISGRVESRVALVTGAARGMPVRSRDLDVDDTFVRMTCLAG
jgi:hypothetical protein